MAGPLTDIIQMLLTAIFSVQAEEAAEKRDSQAGNYFFLNNSFYSNSF